MSNCRVKEKTKEIYWTIAAYKLEGVEQNQSLILAVFEEMENTLSSSHDKILREPLKKKKK